ncbi:secreted RxLR effector protein 161-like [Primulina tabacum]|uniref:secreted RxLR effector protein 161-like n=1 Tax=Primulina tabacum TaxID=48773 RepID=UPI003F5990F1
MDVKSAFLNGFLSDEVHVRQPKEFEYPHNLNHVYKLKKALYGLKQAPRAWYGRLTDYLLDIGFKQGEHTKTPMGSNEKLSKDVAAEDVDNTLYRSIIGSLLYLTASRLDLMFSVCLCARYQSNPKISHLKAVKRILRYIAGTIDLGLWYTHETNSNLVGFSDADWAGDLDDRKSTSGGCFYLGNNLISWHSIKQNCVSLSTAESEYVAAGSGCTQLLWMNQMIS